MNYSMELNCHGQIKKKQQTSQIVRQHMDILVFNAIRNTFVAFGLV